MSAATANNIRTSFTSVDLSAMMGYPLRIHINGAAGSKPLFWESWSRNERIASGEFLQSPGLPLNALIPKHERMLIPPQVLAIAYAVPRKQFQLLQAMLVSKPALELALSNPLLFVLLVDYAEYHGFDVPAFKKIVLVKRTSILSQMGLVDSMSAVRALARTSLYLHHYPSLQVVIRVLEDERLIVHLCHVKRPTIAAFLLLCRNPKLVWPGLLDMLQPDSGIADTIILYRLARDSHALGASIKKLQNIRNQDQLQALHDRLVDRYSAHNNVERAAHYMSIYGEYPAPPIAGTEQILPLFSWEELLIEGQRMNHCVASFHNRIYAGSVFIYRVLGEEQLTLSLAKKQHDWILEELKGYANCAPSSQDLELVQRWMAIHGKGDR